MCDSSAVPAALHLPSTRRDFLRGSCLTAWGSSPDVWPCSQPGDVLLPTILAESRGDSIEGTRGISGGRELRPAPSHLARWLTRSTRGCRMWSHRRLIVRASTVALSSRETRKATGHLPPQHAVLRQHRPETQPGFYTPGGVLRTDGEKTVSKAPEL